MKDGFDSSSRAGRERWNMVYLGFVFGVEGLGAGDTVLCGGKLS